MTVPPNHMMTLGARMTHGAVNAIRANSIAARAGFQRGDVILKVDGDANFDPMRLPDYIYHHSGQKVTFDVQRSTAGGKTETVALSAVPDDTPAGAESIHPREPLEVPGLGLAFPVLPRVASVLADTPAAKAGLKPGDAKSPRSSSTIPRWPERRAQDGTIEVNARLPTGCFPGSLFSKLIPTPRCRSRWPDQKNPSTFNRWPTPPGSRCNGG